MWAGLDDLRRTLWCWLRGYHRQSEWYHGRLHCKDCGTILDWS
jgi:hypothetical protein